ncbi:spore coat protein, CotS family [Melghirimyces thermohalophilus]|uniref:Spore coat protein, CotS family n=1 Tax=Melghirimyces thermohalophilus TaxID=1236220 RepID=A0A1G6PMQ2_9BACL|nr:spore coat protein, CotS family [Melghirimyces thermohalophilus]
MRPNKIVRQLSRRFGIPVKEMSIVKTGVYRVVTPGGKKYVFKRMAYPPARLRWIDRTLLRLRRDGSVPIVWRRPHKRWENRLFVRVKPQGPPYTINPWAKGRWPSPRSTKEMEACGRLLATFHRSGNNIAIPKKGQNNQMGRWPSYLRSELNVLRRVISKAKRNGFRSPLDKMLQKHGEEILQMGRAALRALKQSRYPSICQQRKATLCHGDGGPSNFLLHGNRLRLIDFETLRLDLPSYDLYRVIFNSCKDHHWNFTIARSILDGYQQVNQLQPSDFEMLKILLRFPRGMCKLIEHYDKKSAKEKRRIEREFPRILAEERKMNSFIKQLENYAQTG